MAETFNFRKVSALVQARVDKRNIEHKEIEEWTRGWESEMEQEQKESPQYAVTAVSSYIKGQNNRPIRVAY